MAGRKQSFFFYYSTSPPCLFLFTANQADFYPIHWFRNPSFDFCQNPLYTYPVCKTDRSHPSRFSPRAARAQPGVAWRPNRLPKTDNTCINYIITSLHKMQYNDYRLQWMIFFFMFDQKANKMFVVYLKDSRVIFQIHFIANQH